MRAFCYYLLGFAGLMTSGCSKSQKEEAKPVRIETPVSKPETTEKKFTGKKVPVLCYHAIREILPGDGPDQKAYSVSPSNFKEQIRLLADEGYTTISPDELLEFHTKNRALPEKPIIITFDDGRKDQFEIGASTLEKHNFKGVFYIMTVSLGKKNYMSKDDIGSLSENGHIIGCHTWDHHKVTGYKDKDWELQFTKPKLQLEKLSGKPVTSFAYPYGVWDDEAADSLKTHGYSTAFIFYGKQDSVRPHFTFERIAVSNSTKNFIERIRKAVGED